MNKRSAARWFMPMLLLFFTQVVVAQDTTTLTLQQAIDSALINNDHVKLAKMDEAIAAAGYKQTQGFFMPRLGLTYTAIATNNPLNAFGFKLQQQSITQADFNPVLLNEPSATPDYMMKLQLQQPIMNMDLLYMRKSAAKQMEVYSYTTKRTKEHAMLEVQQAYLNLQMIYKSKAVFEESLQTARAIKELTDNYAAQGMAQKSDLLNAQVQVNKLETNIAEVNSQVQDASDVLSLLMGKAKGVVYSLPQSFTFLAEISSEVLPEKRADFNAIESAIDAYDMAIKSDKMSYLPRLNAFASYQFNDNSAFGFASNAYLAGVQISWDIFNGNVTKNKIATQTAERNKLAAQLSTQKSESELELNKAMRRFANAQYTATMLDIAVAQAKEALRILQDRYEQGLSKTTDVLMAQTQLSQQQLAHAQAVFTANIAAAYIKFLTTSNQ